MLSKYKDVRPKKGTKSPLQNVFMSAAYSDFFSGRGHQNLTFFKRSFFFGRVILKHIENKKGSRGL